MRDKLGFILGAALGTAIGTGLVILFVPSDSQFWFQFSNGLAIMFGVYIGGMLGHFAWSFLIRKR